MSTHQANSSEERDLELPVEELLRRARPLPPHEEMVIDDLNEEEGAAFLDASSREPGSLVRADRNRHRRLQRRSRSWFEAHGAVYTRHRGPAGLRRVSDRR
jgi:hypothetical protein